MRGLGLVFLCALAGCHKPDAELIQEVSRVIADPVLRPSHVDPPIAGAFAEYADRSLRSIHGRSWQDLPELQRRSPQEVLDGATPFAEVPGQWQAEIDDKQAALASLIAGTTAASGRLPEPLNVFNVLDEHPPYNFVDVQQAARLLGLMAQRAVEAGAPEQALELCAGGLALARDLSAPHILGNMVGASLVGILTPSCLAATRAAAPEANRRWVRQLNAIRSGWRPFARVLEAEKLFLRLIVAANDPATRAALPPPAQRFVAAQPEGPSGTWETLRAKLLVGAEVQESLARTDRVIAALQLAPREADERIAALGAETTWVMALAGPEGRPSNYLGYVRKDRETQAKLSLLVAAAGIFAAYREQGRWPTTWGQAFPEESEVPVDARSGLAFALRPAPEGPTIHALPDGERTEADLDLRFGPP